MSKDLKKLYDLVSKNYKYQTHTLKKYNKNINHLLNTSDFTHKSITNNFITRCNLQIIANG